MLLHTEKNTTSLQSVYHSLSQLLCSWLKPPWVKSFISTCHCLLIPFTVPQIVEELQHKDRQILVFFLSAFVCRNTCLIFKECMLTPTSIFPNFSIKSHKNKHKAININFFTSFLLLQKKRGREGKRNEKARSYTAIDFSPWGLQEQKLIFWDSIGTHKNWQSSIWQHNKNRKKNLRRKMRLRPES